jgi:prepilin-type N-terminal cleavage/methylation domain-containing protein
MIRAGRPGHSGFTLVELLIAATMMSVLFIGLGSHLRGGITVWRQTTQRVEALQRQRIALDRLERDLANGIVYDSRDEAYGVEAGKLPLPAFTSASLAWYTVSSAGKPPSVRFVTYACESPDGAPGLWRTSQSVGEARTHREPAHERLLPDCEALQVRYAYAPVDESAPLEWQPVWLFGEELPRLIEVTVRRTAAEQTTRVMAIPHGSFEQVPGSP